MNPLPHTASDDDLLRFVDGWVSLLEREDYASAFAYTAHDPAAGWTPDLIRELITSYGEGRFGQRATVAGVPSDVSQRKAVDRWPRNHLDEIGEIWYDLNIDGVASDLTATFRIVHHPRGLLIRLADIHVM